MFYGFHCVTSEVWELVYGGKCQSKEKNVLKDMVAQINPYADDTPLVIFQHVNRWAT